ncbi:hypothetical protein L483_20680 [Pseudomonas putida H8234]|nr:hypothetical protein L483_20680 [Pseudomonas putida H8234]
MGIVSDSSCGAVVSSVELIKLMLVFIPILESSLAE